jgi:hypothetical protein
VNVIDQQADTENPDMETSGRRSNHRKEYQAVPDRIENQESVNGFLIDVLNSTIRENQSSLHIAPPLFYTKIQSADAVLQIYFLAGA